MEILKIEKFEDLNIEKDGCSKYDGFKIETNSGDFIVAVSSSQSCCENWGQITSADNLDDFIGAEIANYRFDDSDNYQDCEILKNKFEDYVDVLDCAFISLETDRGLLQFAVYNHHNGYYGHHVMAKVPA